MPFLVHAQILIRLSRHHIFKSKLKSLSFIVLVFLNLTVCPVMFLESIHYWVQFLELRSMLDLDSNVGQQPADISRLVHSSKCFFYKIDAWYMFEE